MAAEGADDPALPSAAPRELTCTIGNFHKFRLRIALPPSYDQPAAQKDKYNVLYVLDADPAVYESCRAAAVASHEAVRDKEGRNWHPELIVVAAGLFPARWFGALPFSAMLVRALTNIYKGAFMSNSQMWATQMEMAIL